MTTERQKYAVRWINDLFRPYKFFIPAPKDFEPFDEEFIEDSEKVHEFLSKWLEYAKSKQYDIISQKEIIRADYDDWENK